MSKLLNFIGVLCLVVSITSCKSEYARYVEREINSGVKNDSLIFGLFMGQTKKEFFTHCWELNSQKVISQGNGANVKYIDPVDSLEDPTLRKELLFYGIFDEDNIMRGMRMNYSFTAWSPWVKRLHSDSLVVHVKQKMMDDYGGNDFIEIDLDDTKYKAFVKIDGNRQILVYPVSNKDVKVKIEDLNYKVNKEWADKAELEDSTTAR